jgi:hypothetical protein
MSAREPVSRLDKLRMPSGEMPTWRNDIDALAFQPAGHTGFCMVHRRAFRTLLRMLPTPQQCVDFFDAHRAAFQAAARAKMIRSEITQTANFHLTSRDVTRQMKN